MNGMGVVGRGASLVAALKAAGVAVVQKRREEAVDAMRWERRPRIESQSSYPPFNDFVTHACLLLQSPWCVGGVS